MLSLKGKGGQPFQSTPAKQLANYIILYAPLQMAADLPENHRRYPAPFQFIKDVPTDWAQTLVPNGEVGDYVTIVHKDCNSDDRHLGNVTDENARTLEVQLDFLDPDRADHAHIYRDAPMQIGARIRSQSQSSDAKSAAATRCTSSSPPAAKPSASSWCRGRKRVYNSAPQQMLHC